MPDLTETERRILSALGEWWGSTTGDVASRVDPVEWSLSTGRKFSLGVGKNLKALRDRGLVAHLDNMRPVCWVRTRAGTEALKKEEANV